MQAIPHSYTDNQSATAATAATATGATATAATAATVATAEAAAIAAAATAATQSFENYFVLIHTNLLLILSIRKGLLRFFRERAVILQHLLKFSP